MRLPDLDKQLEYTNNAQCYSCYMYSPVMNRVNVLPVVYVCRRRAILSKYKVVT